MTILIVSAQIPYPPDQGSKIRNYNLIKYLSENYQVVLVCLASEPATDEAISELKKYCREVICVSHQRNNFDKIFDFVKSTFSGLPYTVLANTSKLLQQKVRALFERYAVDIVQLEELYVAHNFTNFKLSCPVVLDAHNREATILETSAETTRSFWRKIFSQTQAKKMQEFERQVIERMDYVFGVTAAEVNYFAQYAKRTALVPNGVAEIEIPDKKREKSLLFCGSLDYYPNQDAVFYFLDQIWPIILKHSPELNLKIVGRKAPAAIYKRIDKRVSVFADVSDVKNFFQAASILVVPLRAGGGSRIKILQAFSYGLPVVSSTIGAAGLEVEDAKEILLRDSVEGFAQAVLEVIDSKDRKQQLALAAERLVRQRYLWRTIFGEVSKAYQAIV